MAKFTGYARPSGFNAIQAPDESQKYLQQGNNFIRSLQTAAQFDIAEKNRRLQAIVKNNDLENANRDFIFKRDMENKQRVQQAILGNYNIAIQNAETQALNQAKFYEQLGNFSAAAVQAGTTIYKKVQAAQQQRVDQAVYAAGPAAVGISMEYAKLGKNVTDEVINSNPYFQELIHNNGITTNQIRFLGESSQAGKFVKSRAYAEQLGKQSDIFYAERGDQTFDIGGTQISLNQAESQGNQVAAAQIRSILYSEFYQTYGLNQFPTETLQQYVNPFIRAAENQSAQRAASNYRQEKAKELANEEYLSYKQQETDGGPQGLATSISQAENTAVRSNRISGSFRYYQNDINRAAAEGNPDEAIARYTQFLNSPTIKNGREMTIGEALAGRPEIEALSTTIEKARDAYQQRLIEETQRPAIEAAILENRYLTENPPQTEEEVAKLYERLRAIPGNSGYTSTRLEAILRNETTEAKAVAAMRKDFERLRRSDLLTYDYMLQRGAPLELMREFGAVAKATQEGMAASGNYKTEMEAIEKAVMGMPGVVKGPNSVVHWTVPIKIKQLQNQFASRMATLRAGGDTSAALPTQVAADIIRGFQASSKPSTNKGQFGGFDDISNISSPNGKASARMRWTLDQLEAAGRENRTNTFLDQDGAVYSVSELKDIITASKQPGWKPDSVAVDIGRRLGVSPLTVINRQIAARQDPSLPLVRLPEPLMKYQTGIRPEFLRMLETTPTPEISRRAMGSTGVFEPATIKPFNGIDIGGLIAQAAAKYNLPPAVLAGLLSHESGGFNPSVLTGQKRSTAGAIGIAQFMPGTAAEMGVDPLNIPQAIDGAARYLSQNMRHPNNPGNSLNWAISAYNSGPGGVGMSQENREYFGKVMAEAYKYGHGRQALQHSSLMRPSMRRLSQASFERPSSINFESAGGQPGVDLYFESKRFPAVLGGVVKDVSREPGYGNYVVIESTDPITGQKVDVLYGHLADGVAVQPGQQIDAGDIIGIQGGTGNVRSVDGTIASIDFLAPAPRGSKSMKPYAKFDQLRRYIVSQLQR